MFTMDIKPMRNRLLLILLNQYQSGLAANTGNEAGMGAITLKCDLLHYQGCHGQGKISGK